MRTPLPTTCHRQVGNLLNSLADMRRAITAGLDLLTILPDAS